MFLLIEILLYFVLFQQRFNILDGWFFLVLSITFFGIFSNIQNNILDYEPDQHKENFVPFNRTTYLIWSLIFGILGAILGFTAFYFTFDPWLLYAVLSIPILIILYNYFFKKWAVIGNLAIAFTATLAIFIPIGFTKGLHYQNAYFEFLLLVLFFLMFIRELIKDMEDAEIDKKFGYKTLPVLNLQISKWLVVILSLTTWLVMFSFRSIFDSYYFYALLLISFILMALAIIKTYQNKYEMATKLIKGLMLVGILSIFFM